MAAPRFQAASLVGVPTHPNAIAWSDDNLIAVASGHIVTILNPALPGGPRGTITVPTGKPYPFGRVEKKDLLSGDLLPAALSRDRRPCVRSIAWSPLGMSPNYGCLLAVCTVEGCVKIFRPPFSDFSSNWIEVADISDMLYDHLSKNNFTEIDTSSSEIPTEQPVNHLQISRIGDSRRPIIIKQYKRRKVIAATDTNINTDSFVGQLSEPKRLDITNTRCTRHNILDCKSSPKAKLGKLGKNAMGSTIPLLTSKEYAKRSALLSSLVLAWSPLFSTSLVSSDDLSERCSILAVGGKSGKVSFWRLHAPHYYSVDHSNATADVTFLGVVQAHTSWITAVSLELLVSNSEPQVVMVTGSTDGSVKIWLANLEQLLKLSKASKAPFVVINEVLQVNIVPISAISVLVPVQPVHKMLIAAGKGSGSFEIWTCDTSSFKFEKSGYHEAHDYAVTGLCWSFDGYSLYSCGQDNYVRSWVLRGSNFCEVPVPSTIPSQAGSDDLPDALLSCLGVAVSPGNLMVAMVRDFDVELLEHMYEARAQKAVVEFFWIGGQLLESTSSSSTEFHQEAFTGFPPNDLAAWESNTLWSLKQYEDPNKPLVMWDITTALLGFKVSIPKYLESLLVKWLSTTFLGQYADLPLCEILRCVMKSFLKVPSRHLHLLNIVTRRVLLSELKAEEINSNATNGGVEDETVRLGLQMLLGSEKELRERLVGLSFAAFSGSDSATTSVQPESWSPLGVVQMEQWVRLNHAHVKDQLKDLASEVQKHARKATEQCTFCSASVPFESPEFATCNGSETVGRDLQKHELPRCAVSMQVCPAVPLWFCKCCHRKVHRLASDYLFKMPSFPKDFRSCIKESSAVQRSSRPFCPFCGVLMQRLLPDFLLSPQPV